MTTFDIYTGALINQVATELRIADTQWLIDLIEFESGWNPQAKNSKSSARGLIQFIDSTAKELGYTDSADLVTKNPDIESQLIGPVLSYLKRYMPFNTEHSLYMAVFFPAARKYPAEMPFSKIFFDIYGTNWESKYKAFEKANPKIKTPADYVGYLKKNGKTTALATTGIFALIAVATFLMLKSKGREKKL